MQNNQQEFLLSFFDDKELGYAEREINGFVLVRQIHGTSKEPLVAVYTPESFKKYKDFGLQIDLWKKPLQQEKL